MTVSKKFVSSGKIQQNIVLQLFDNKYLCDSKWLHTRAESAAVHFSCAVKYTLAVLGEKQTYIVLTLQLATSQP